MNPLSPINPKLSPVVHRNTESSVRSQKNQQQNARQEGREKGSRPVGYYKRAVTARRRPMIENIYLDKHYAAGAKALEQEDYKAHTNRAHTYCERGEGHAHAPKAIESQGNEDKDRELCK